MPNVQLYSLQKVNGTHQLRTTPGAERIITFTDDFDEAHGRFMDTAALICALDLIITIDTSIAHLAAGLGKKVWLLLPYHADWRWLANNRSDSPWYPTMRLFWQQQEDDWETVIARVVRALKKESVLF